MVWDYGSYYEWFVVVKIVECSLSMDASLWKWAWISWDTVDRAIATQPGSKDPYI